MNVESRLHQCNTNTVDMIYSKLSVFERREMIKVLLLPLMKLFRIYQQMFVYS